MKTTMTIVIFDGNMAIWRYVLSVFISFPADVDVVNIGSLLLIRSNGYGRSDGWFGYLLNFDTPLIFWFFKIGESKFGLSVRDGNIDSIFAENTMNFRNHFISIGS